MKLEAELYNKILEFSNNGEKYFNKKQFDLAIEYYEKGLELVPYPQSDWEAAVWLNVALGDAYFKKSVYTKALNYFYDAMNGPNAIDNPFINLRLGQCLFELNDKEKAEDCLLRAYMLDGTKIFKGENKKYRIFLKEKYKL